jgi:hypothetical protein
MKSIKQQYIDLQEGNMSQANFMRNLRMALPQYITNVTSYQDSIKILKNKGILNEVASPSELAMGIKVEMEHTDDVQVAKKIAMDHLAENPNYYSDLKKSGVDTAQGLKMTSGSPIKSLTSSGESTLEPNMNRANPRDGFSLGFFEENQEMEGDPATEEEIADMIAKAEEEESGKYTTGGEQFPIREAKDEKGRWTNANGKSMYDQFKEIDNLNGQEVLIGIDYEIQKNPELTKVAAAKIVLKNLKKNPIYYTASLMAGKEGYEPEYIGGKSADPEAHQMQFLDKNMSNVVDKKRGMQPVKGIEKPKKDADAKKETNKPEKGIELMSLIAKTVRGLKKMDATGEKMKKLSLKEAFSSNPNKMIMLVTKFINNSPTLDAMDLIAQKDGDGVILQYGYWDPLPSIALKELEKQFNVEIMDMDDEETGPGIGYRLTTKMELGSEEPGFSLNEKKLNKEALLKMIREELNEITGAYGGDVMDAEDGSSYTN